MVTMNAFRFMNTQYTTTLRACPSFHFVFNETLYAYIFDSGEILYHTHAIVCFISLIQMVQSGTRKTVTFKAEINSAAIYLLAVLNMAGDTGF